MQKKKNASIGQGSGASREPKSIAADSTRQLRATAAAKDARKAEAGLAGKRIGKASASGKRSQGRRDSKTVKVPSISPPSRSTAAIQRPSKNSVHVQVNTDHTVRGSALLDLHVRSTVEASLGRFAGKITRVEVHLTDVNGVRTRGDDKRCLLEARPAGRKPVVVTHVGGTIEEAVDGAVEKMEKLLDSTFARLYDPKGRTSFAKKRTV